MSDQYRHPFAWLAAFAALITIIVGIFTLREFLGCSSSHPTPPPVTGGQAPTISAPPTFAPPQEIDFVGTWQCIDPNTNKLLKTVKFNADFTYKEWRGNQIVGTYRYDKQTKELSFVYVHENRGGREDLRELGRVTPIDKTTFKFKVLEGDDLILPRGSIYEFRR